MRLLVIEDEARLVEVLRSALGRAGFVVDAVDSAADAREALALVAYDATILDLGLPDGDGLEILAEVRRAGRNIPALASCFKGESVLHRGRRPLDFATSSKSPRP
jgi:two-component system response regulator QseB